MLICIFLIYNAIKKIPFGKKAILALSYIPILIEGITSLSGDGILISCSFLFIAEILNVRHSDYMMNTKQKIIIFILALIIGLSKMVYLPLLTLLFLIPKEKMKSHKNTYVIITIIIVLLAYIGWSSFTVIYKSENRSGTDIKEIIVKTITNPIDFLAEITATIEYLGDHYIKNFYGSELGWLENIKSNFFVPTILLVTSFLAIVNDSKIKLEKKENIIFILCIILTTLMIFTSLYISWTITGNNIIQGVQGRYFIPIAPLIFLLISNLKISANYSEQTISKFIGIIGCLVNNYVCINILMHNI